MKTYSDKIMKRGQNLYQKITLIPLSQFTSEDEWPMGIASHLNLIYAAIEEDPNLPDLEIAENMLELRMTD